MGAPTAAINLGVYRQHTPTSTFTFASTATHTSDVSQFSQCEDMCECVYVIFYESSSSSSSISRSCGTDSPFQFMQPSDSNSPLMAGNKRHPETRWTGDEILVPEQPERDSISGLCVPEWNGTRTQMSCLRH